MKPVIVEWVDITSYNGWNDDILDDNDLLYKFNTIGFIIKQTEDILVISDTYPEIGSVVAYPIGCVLSITELEVKE
jgi:hypothetical protein